MGSPGDDVEDLSKLRREYESSGIDVEALPGAPLPLWQAWLGEAQAAGIAEINAVIVATVDADGTPSTRTVLCKGADGSGFVFFSNYDSRKGRALASDGRVSLLFPWHPLARQVIVTGAATPVSRAESEEYFASRPRGSQLSAWASAQSSVVTDRAQLEAQWAEVEGRFEGGDVPCPPHWGGYRVSASAVEFWQGRRDRLHDRLVFRRTADGGAMDDPSAWTVVRLAP
jgi:pyridoxamine 5'-phosphate oxidase